MNTNSEQNVSNETPAWLVSMLPYLSALLGGCAIWYTWFKYNDLVSQSGDMWYEWLRPAFMLLIGILCLVATVLFILGKSSGSSVLMLGLIMVPIMLFSNLIILLIRVMYNVVTGNAQPFFDRIFDQPTKLIAIPIVVIALILLSMMSKDDKTNNSN